jgi:hypothetical protein
VLSALVGVTTPLPWRGAASADAPDPAVTAVGTVPMARTTRAATASAARPLSTPADAALDWTRCDQSESRRRAPRSRPSKTMTELVDDMRAYTRRRRERARRSEPRTDSTVTPSWLAMRS